MLLGLRAKFLDAARAATAARSRPGARRSTPPPRRRSRPPAPGALNAMGDLAHGPRRRRSGRRQAARGARPRPSSDRCLPEVRAAYINLADAAAPARALGGGARAWRTRAPSARPGPAATARGSSAVEAEIALDLGDWAYAERHLPDPGAASPAPTFVNFALRQRRARARAGRRRRARGRCSTTSTRPRSTSTSRSSSASWARCAPSSSAAPATSTRPARRSAAALDRIEICTDDVVRLARVAAVGVVVEADAAAARPRPRRRRGPRAARSWRPSSTSAASSAAAEDGGPVEAGVAARAPRPSSPRANAAGRTPRRHEAAAQAWEARRAPVPRRAHALARRPRRRSRPATRERGDRRRSGARTRSPRDLGAGWLRGRDRGPRRPRAAASSPGADGEMPRAPSRPRSPRRTRSGSRRASARFSSSWPRAARTARSATRSSWPRRRPASTCRGSSPSSTCAAARRPRRWPTASASTAT